MAILLGVLLGIVAVLSVAVIILNTFISASLKDIRRELEDL